MSKYFDNKDSFLEPRVNQYNSHMVMTNVSQPTRKKYINIDSRNLDVSGNSIANYTIMLPERINNVKSIMVCNAEVPISYYNVSSNLGNNSFGVYNVDNATSGSVVVSNGNYTSSTLVTEINSKLYSLGSYFEDLSFNIYNNFVISSVKNDSTYASTGVDVNFAVNSSNEFDKYNFKAKLGWLLGFRDTSYNMTSTTRTAEALPDLNGPRYLYLVVDEFTKGNQSSFLAINTRSQIQGNILARITMNKTTFGFGNILPANNFNGYLLTDRRSYNGRVDLQKLKIQLTDEYGTPVDLNGSGFSFCLEVEYE
jgi:hypothetical protein